MMRMEEELLYAAGNGYQVVDLPYAGHELSMTVIVPDGGRFREFEASLDASLVDRIIGSLDFRYVSLDLPKFGFESQFRRGETLKSMGMSDAFDSAASDFSGMDGRSCLAGDLECLYIREVVHKAFVSVDEAGTEAAAATAVVMQTESAKPTPGQRYRGQALHLPDPGPGDGSYPLCGARGGDVGCLPVGVAGSGRGSG